MNKSFEDYLNFLENDLRYEFFDYQKAILHKAYKCKPLYYCGNRYYGVHWLYEIMRNLKEELDLDDSDLLQYIYKPDKPDGYSATYLMYDENYGENIE